jgi:hypothetical protein
MCTAPHCCQAYKEVLTNSDKFKEMFPDGVIVMGARNEGGEFNTRAGVVIQ